MKKSILFIWALIIVDLLSGLLLNLQVPFARIGLVVKGLVVLFLFANYFVNIKKKTYYSIYSSIAILLLFWIIGFCISFVNDPNFDPIESVVVINRYFFFLVLACAFKDWSAMVSFEGDCKKIIETFFTINNALILLGFAFKIKIFSTYDTHDEFGESARFGYKGLIWAQNGVAAIYTLGMAYLFRECVKYNRPKIILLLSTCIAALFIGTKATWFTFILLAGYYLYKYKIRTLILIIIPVLVGVVYLFGVYWSYVKEKYLAFMVVQYEQNDFYSFFTSNRNNLLLKQISHISTDWNWLNFIVGDAISYCEMDFFDLYFYFGISAFLYLFVYFKIFFFKDKSGDNNFFFWIWISMAFFSGHIINSAAVPIFYLLFIFSASPQSRFTPNGGSIVPQVT
jgi:hypothetical protein